MALTAPGVLGRTAGTATPVALTEAQLAQSIAQSTNTATSKATPVDADQLPITDSAASHGLKKLTWANLKATLKTYFDTLYQPTLVSGTNIKTVNGSSLLGSGDLVVTASSTAFLENDQTVTQNYTITAGKNAGSFGPVTINTGVGVTVSSGQVWTIVGS